MTGAFWNQHEKSFAFTGGFDQNGCPRALASRGLAKSTNLIMQKKTRRSLRYPQDFSSTLAQRFWAKVQKTIGCWLWTGAKTTHGYAHMHTGPRSGAVINAARISWLIHFGEIPPGLCVLHRCDNEGCVNPEHLFLGTNKDNTLDMFHKGRGFQKLTLAQVQEIRALKQSGLSGWRISKLYPVCYSQIKKILSGRAWRQTAVNVK